MHPSFASFANGASNPLVADSSENITEFLPGTTNPKSEYLPGLPDPEIAGLSIGDVQGARARPPLDREHDGGERSTESKVALGALAGVGLGKTVLDQTRMYRALPNVPEQHRRLAKFGFLTNTAFADRTVPVGSTAMPAAPRFGLGAAALGAAGLAIGAPKIASAIEEDGPAGLVTTGDGRAGLASVAGGLLAGKALNWGTGSTWARSYGFTNSLGGLMGALALGVGVPNAIDGFQEGGFDGLVSTEAGRTGMLQLLAGGATAGALGLAAWKSRGSGAAQAGKLALHHPMVQGRAVGAIGLGTTALTIANETGYLGATDKRNELIAGAGAAGLAGYGIHRALQHEAAAAKSAGAAAWQHTVDGEPLKALAATGKRIGLNTQQSWNAAKTGMPKLFSNPTAIAAKLPTFPSTGQALKGALISKPGIGLAVGAGALAANALGAFDFLNDD